MMSVALATNANAASHDPSFDASLRRLEALIEQGMSAREFTAEMYTPDTVVKTHGPTPPRKGLAAEEVSIAAFLDSLAPPGQRKCTFEPVDPVTRTAEVTAAFINFSCRGKDATTAEPNQKYHILYVWKKVGDDWKVALEMF